MSTIEKDWMLCLTREATNINLNKRSIRTLFGSKLGLSRILDSLGALSDGVHAFGYNSVESEPIWTKSGSFWVRCLGLALADFERDPCSNENWRAVRSFFCFFLSGKQRTILPISRRRNFTKFEHNTSIDEAMNPFGTEFWKIFRKRSFSKKTQKIDFFQRLVTSGRHNSAVITFTNRRKFITKEPSTRCLVSIFTVGINWKWFPWPVHSV